MTVLERENALVEELTCLPDVQDRLLHLMRRAERRDGLAESERVAEALVPGCVSRVWLVGSVDQGTCRFRVAADSPMVLGLVGLVCDVYEGAAPEEVRTARSDILSRTGLDRHLSPTRLQGLGRALVRLRRLAEGFME
jgi:cysteine desulfuration protein SufE